MSARSMAKAGLVLIGAWAFAVGPAVGQEHGRVKQITPITAPELVQKLEQRQRRTRERRAAGLRGQYHRLRPDPHR